MPGLWGARCFSPGSVWGGASAVTAAASDAVTKVPTQGEIDKIFKNRNYRLVDQNNDTYKFITEQGNLERDTTRTMYNEYSLQSNLRDATNKAAESGIIVKAELVLTEDNSKKLFNYLMSTLKKGDDRIQGDTDKDKLYKDLQKQEQGQYFPWYMQFWGSSTDFAKESARIIQRAMGLSEDKIKFTGVIPRFEQGQHIITAGADETSYAKRVANFGPARDIDFYSGIRLDLDKQTATVFVDMSNLVEIRSSRSPISSDSGNVGSGVGNLALCGLL